MPHVCQTTAVCIGLRVGGSGPLSAEETADPPQAGPGAKGGGGEVSELSRMELFAIHDGCSQAARRSVLSPGEAALCARAFLELKLSFLPGMTLDRYESLAAAERVSANRAGYAAFRDWVDRREQGPGVIH